MIIRIVFILEPLKRRLLFDIDKIIGGTIIKWPNNVKKVNQYNFRLGKVNKNESDK